MCKCVISSRSSRAGRGLTLDDGHDSALLDSGGALETVGVDSTEELALEVHGVERISGLVIVGLDLTCRLLDWGLHAGTHMRVCVAAAVVILFALSAVSSLLMLPTPSRPHTSHFNTVHCSYLPASMSSSPLSAMIASQTRSSLALRSEREKVSVCGGAGGPRGKPPRWWCRCVVETRYQTVCSDSRTVLVVCGLSGGGVLDGGRSRAARRIFELLEPSLHRFSTGPCAFRALRHICCSRFRTALSEANHSAASLSHRWRRTRKVISISLVSFYNIDYAYFDASVQRISWRSDRVTG